MKPSRRSSKARKKNAETDVAVNESSLQASSFASTGTPRLVRSKKTSASSTDAAVGASKGGASHIPTTAGVSRRVPSVPSVPSVPNVSSAADVSNKAPRTPGVVREATKMPKAGGGMWGGVRNMPQVPHIGPASERASKKVPSKDSKKADATNTTNASKTAAAPSKSVRASDKTAASSEQNTIQSKSASRTISTSRATQRSRFRSEGASPTAKSLHVSHGRADTATQRASKNKRGQTGANDRMGTQDQAQDKPKTRKGISRKFLTVSLVIITTLVIGIGLMAWNQWFRYDDTADIQGTWTIDGSSETITITDSEMIMTDDVSYTYSLDTFEKTITFSFEQYSGEGSYAFSFDRTTFVITETDADSGEEVSTTLVKQ